jgi:hypothetical protein
MVRGGDGNPIRHGVRAAAAALIERRRVTRMLRLELRIASRRVAAELDLRSATAAVSVSHRRTPVARQEDPSPTPAPPVPLPPLGAPPAREPARLAPPAEPKPRFIEFPLAGPALAEPPPAARPLPAEPLEDRVSEPPRRSSRGRWAVVALVAAGLTVLGAVAASKLASTGASGRAQGPPAPSQPVAPPTKTAHRPRSSPPPAGATTSSSRANTTTTSTAATTTTTPRAQTTVVPAAPREHTKPPAGGLVAPRIIRWAPRPGTVAYWFELYRRGDLGARKVLEAWPVEAQFTIPVRAPDGTRMSPGIYNWSASPQSTRKGRIRYTTVTKAGRFLIKQDGRVVLNPR